ncbi:hypothetical protein ACWC5I_06760 [Kitasatospora sp. NPDC001574]
MTRRCWLAAASGAPDVEQVRGLWRAARAAGEPRWYLDLIARIGRQAAEVEGGGHGVDAAGPAVASVIKAAGNR